QFVFLEYKALALYCLTKLKLCTPTPKKQIDILEYKALALYCLTKLKLCTPTPKKQIDRVLDFYLFST
ncbi:hypothetical protein PN36_19140, partial [Candidatus Thiomargarita nelsonii]